MTPGPDDDVAARVLVIIPTYNERDNLRAILTRLLDANPAVAVLVVDDGSPDGTGELAEELAAADDRIHVRHRSTKSGLGGAYLAGFEWGLARGYDAFVEMDADGSHAPEQLPQLLAALAAGADLVIGSRWVSGGKVVNWPLRREILSRGASRYTRLTLGLRVRDATAGYRVYRRTTLERIGLADVQSQGYCFQVDLAWRTAGRSLRIVEVPITFTERERGESKMSFDIMLEALVNITRWGARYRLDQLRRRLGRSPARADHDAI